MEKLEKLKEYVRVEWFNRAHSWQGDNHYSKLITAPDDVEHVIQCGASVLMTRYPELGGYLGGSFVQAVVNNDLMDAFGRADNVNQIAMKFYLELLYNFSPDKI